MSGKPRARRAFNGAQQDYFGYSVALSGENALVGAYSADPDGVNGAGAAYIFLRSGTTWKQVAQPLFADGLAQDTFGYSVSLSGDTALVGAPFANVGANDSQGAADIFGRNQGSADGWGQAKKLTASDGTSFDYFGISVSLDRASMNGQTALVGANGFEAAYIFELNTGGQGNWGEIGRAHV